MPGMIGPGWRTVPGGTGERQSGPRSAPAAENMLPMAWLDFVGQGPGRLLGRALDLVYPPRCVFCRTESASPPAGEVVVCGTCSGRLAADGPRCPACGEPGLAPVACRRCRGRGGRGGLVVLAAYDDEVRSAVLAAKRPGGELQAAGLATLLARRHRDTFTAWRLDLVVPVPLHWLRRMVRAASSADLLAGGLAACLGLPCRGLLRRIRPTRMQNELPPGQRFANVQGAFRVVRPVAGCRVLLVDDVSTTGATIAACREALVAAGAEIVHAAVVARADRGTGRPDKGPEVT